LPRISDPIVVSAVAGTGASSAVVDFYTRRIPNPLTLGVAAFGVTLAAAHLTPLSMADALVGFAVGLVLMLPGHLIGATGAGDVKLFAAVGTLLGPRAIAMAFLYTALAGGALAIVVAMQRQLLRETVERAANLVRTGGANVAEIERATVNRFAYAPAIAVGTLAAALGF
jgi:prepilin peptidase CpaA